MKQQLKLFAGALVLLATTSSLVAYFFLPTAMQEGCYMLAGLFTFMAAFCLF